MYQKPQASRGFKIYFFYPFRCKDVSNNIQVKNCEAFIQSATWYESDSAQCQSVRRLTPRGVSQLWIFEFFFSKNQHLGSSFLEIFTSKKIALTTRNVSQPGVTYLANISAKINLSAKPFQTANQRPKWVRFMKKCKKSRDTATLIMLCYFRISAKFSSNLRDPPAWLNAESW